MIWAFGLERLDQATGRDVPTQQASRHVLAKALEAEAAAGASMPPGAAKFNPAN